MADTGRAAVVPGLAVRASFYRANQNLFPAMLVSMD